ncbi:MAG: DUF55-domain-containing protein [Lentinula lateritia]|nr:MAG: DUF55-domain-containing protein [Lentinula lateritia]
MDASAMYWLLKAEPDSRMVKGKDVKFSVDDFETAKTSAWEGVRNYEARNLMKTMEPGEKESRIVLSLQKSSESGIAAFAEVSKKAYPDYTAWDSSHPYYDTKSDKSSPKWFMVDLTFKSRAKHFVSLALLKHISEHASELPEELAYIGSEGANAIKSMDLINRGRLSVQRVQKPAWDVIELLAERGGWDESKLGKGNNTRGKSTGGRLGNASKDEKNKSRKLSGATRKTRGGKKEVTGEEEVHSEEKDAESEEGGLSEDDEDTRHNKITPGKTQGKGQKRKAASSGHADERPSTRSRTRS